MKCGNESVTKWERMSFDSVSLTSSLAAWSIGGLHTLFRLYAAACRGMLPPRSPSSYPSQFSTHFSLKIIKSHFVIAKSLTFCAAFERPKFFVVPRPLILTRDTFEWQLWRFDLPVSFRKLFNFRCSTLWNPRELFPHILGEFYSPF